MSDAKPTDQLKDTSCLMLIFVMYEDYNQYRVFVYISQVLNVFNYILIVIDVKY